MSGTGSDVTGTGSDRKWEGHVIWDGKPLTSWKKGSWAQIKKREDISCCRHDVPSGWGGKPLTSWKKGMAGSGWGKTAEQCGLKVQSPIQAPGEVLDSKKRRHVGKQKIIYSSDL